MSIVLDNITSLDRLLSGEGSVQKKLMKGEFELHFAELSAEETKYWNNRLNRCYSSSCGCSQGATAIILTMICFISYLFLRHGGFYITWLTCVQALGLFIISGAIGKIIGMKFGKKKFRKTIFDLKSVLQVRGENFKTPFSE